MELVVVAFATVILASLAILAGVWLLVQTGGVVWAGVVLVAALLLDAYAFAANLRQPILSSLLLLLLCVGAGTLIGWWIDERRVLMIALPVAAVSDVVSSLTPSGFTYRVMEDAARGGKLLTYLTVSVPFQGEILNVVGLADLMLLATITLALRNMGAGWWVAFTVPFAGSVLALTVALMVGSMPGVPFLAATTLAFLYFQSRAGRPG